MRVHGLLLAIAYLVGSIPFSFLVARRYGVADVRKVGSGNVGATNVLRSAGKAAGLTAFLLDFAKGALATLIGLRLGGDADWGALAAVTAIVGHMYPVWLGFRGGKGVATGVGAFLPLAPVATGLALVVFGTTLAVTRYFSLASLAGAFGLAALAFVFDAPPLAARLAAAAALLITWRHRENLRRILRGTESRLGQK